jgi:rhodanese-related sulfurtransferase
MRPAHRLALGLSALALAATAHAAGAGGVLINPGDQGERSRFATYDALRGVVETALKREKLGDLSIDLSTDAAQDLASTRSRTRDVFFAPAHVVGSALRYGYTPVMGVDRPVQAVLVAPKASAIDSLEAARGKALGLPAQDSVVTYLLRGEVNAANTTIKKHFGSVYQTRYQEALLVCLQLRRCDVVVVEKALFDRWNAAGEPVKAVMQSKPVPGLALAVKQGSTAAAALPALQSALATAFNASEQAQVLGKLVAVDAPAFEYVSTLGYFTPRSLPGAKVVDAAAVGQLMAAGASYIDTRTEAEFKAGHVPGAKFVPYVEKSAKEADYDGAQDSFDLAKLPADRNAALVFACNGAECWKSFKASHAALKAGYKQVHWFRGGFPEWRAAGLKLDRMD